MYHHAESDKYTNTKIILEEHLGYIKENFRTLFPGESTSGISDLCLVFDDAYFDFYYHIYPIVKLLKIKVVLAVPVELILDDTEFEACDRLSFKHDDVMAEALGYKKGHRAFCTWKEIAEMSDSGLVSVASHSLSHRNLTLLDDNDLEYELKHSRKIIEEKTGIECPAFVFPYGSYNLEVFRKAKLFYSYCFGIRDTYNSNWNGVVGRVFADDLVHPLSPFSFLNRVKYLSRFLIGCLNE